MSSLRTSIGMLGVLLLAGCGAATSPLEKKTPEPTKDLSASLLYDGSALVSGTTSTGAASLAISATILPKTFSDDGLYAHEGPAYPTTYEEKVQAVRDAAMPYAELLVQCAARHPEIALAQPGQTLTEQQLRANLEAVYRCSYDDFAIKPYWIPQLLVDVDVCSVVLGEGWHMPTEAELASFSDPARQVASEAVGAEAYGNTDVFALAADGTLRIGSIAPGVRALRDIVYPLGTGPTHHLEGGAALRCLLAGSAIP